MGDAIDHAQDLALMFQEHTRHGILATIRNVIAVFPEEGRACCDCGDPIPTERLRARPGATRCIECQERKERRDRR